MEAAALFKRRLYESRLTEPLTQQTIMATLLNDSIAAKTTHCRSAPILVCVGVCGLRVDLRARDVGQPFAGRSHLFEQRQWHN